MKVTCVIATSLFVLAGVASGQNLLTNPSFNVNLSGWTLDSPGWSWDSTLNVTPTPGSGSAKNLGGGEMSQCVGGLRATAKYSFGGKVYIPTGQSDSGLAGIYIMWYSTSDCSGQPFEFGLYAGMTSTTGSWVSLDSAPGSFSASAHSAKLVAQLSVAGSSSHVNFDDLYISSVPLAIATTSALPAGTVGVAYSQQLAASGGASPYTWSVVNGSLPGGLSPLTAAGLLSGTPTASGDFSFTVKVTDSASATAQGAFTLHVSDCALPSITSQPPGTTIASGQTATLSVTANGSVTLSYQWYRGASGDTSTPVGSNASSFTTPALTATTSYWVRVSNSCGHADSATATITVGPAYDHYVWVPVASHSSGLNQTQWRTDLGLLNVGTVTANVQIKLFVNGGVVSNTTYVSVGVQSMLTDVVGQLDASGTGALEVISDQSLKVTSRTYTQVPADAGCYPNGTQGQDYPAVLARDGLVATESAYLAGLAENASYHCNIGVVNVGAGNATVLVELYNGAGTKLTDYTVTLAPGQWAQETQPFKSKAGKTAINRGYAKVTVQSGSGVFAFASVIDNLTNDPTTVAMQR